MPRTAGLALALALIAAHGRAEDDVAGLSWMGGRWVAAHAEVETEEYWSSGAGGVMLGFHKEVKGGRLVSFEFLRVAPGDDETLTYFAGPRGAPPTPFRLKEMGARRVVFENAGHDFPQRIVYWLDDSGALHARIEGTLRGQPAEEEWVWQRGAR